MKRKELKELVASKKADLKWLKEMEKLLREDWKKELVPETKSAYLKDIEVVRTMIIETEESIKIIDRKDRKDKTPIVCAVIGGVFSFLELGAICYFEKNEGLLRSNGGFNKWKLFK